MPDAALTFLSQLHPYDRMPETQRREIAARLTRVETVAGAPVYRLGEPLPGLFIVVEGSVVVQDAEGTQLSLLSRGNSFGERGLIADGRAVTQAMAQEDVLLYCLPSDIFHDLRASNPDFQRFFDRKSPPVPEPAPNDLAQVTVEVLMATDPVSVPPRTTVEAAAQVMRKHRISCLCVVEDGTLAGIVTLRDLVCKALADGLPRDTPLAAVMTPRPRALSPGAIGSDVLHMMMEHRIGHLPVVAGGALVGIVTQTDLTRFQASSAASLVSKAAHADGVADLAKVTARMPRLLVQLVAAGHRHDTVTRMITDVADVVTRRLLTLAERQLGTAPMPFLWLACGSQGRQEMTGVSDQDNCLILAEPPDAEAAKYFDALARFVCDGLNDCGYVYCPGEMMASNPRWRQPLGTWQGYFRDWIAKPDKEAQMLASVMFDLRPIGGDTRLFDGLHTETLRQASENSIFTAHMASNALGHAPPLGLLRGLATIRSGEHRDTFDAKLAGVVPVVDLARMYALHGRIEAQNTRVRLEAAIAGGKVSATGGGDLLKAYDLIAQTRLRHQAERIKAGETPDNFVAPRALTDFERSHLRNAFVVVQDHAIGHDAGQGSDGLRNGRPEGPGRGEMLFELIGTIVAGAATALILWAVNRATGGRLPSWIVPAGAGAAMLAAAISSEYGWFGRTTAAMPGTFVVAQTVEEKAIYRPWTYVRPFVTRFVAVDRASIRTHPDQPGQRLVTLVFYGRWARPASVPVLFDCAGARQADIVDGVEFGAGGEVLNRNMARDPARGSRAGHGLRGGLRWNG